MQDIQKVYLIAKDAGMPAALSELIARQAAHETNNFASNVYLRCNNAFGYKAITDAVKCAISPEGNHYKRYGSLRDSVLEVVGWIGRRQKEGKFPANLAVIRDARQYAQLLKNSGYYGDSVDNYTKGLLRHNFEVPETSKIVGAGTILLIIAVIYVAGKLVNKK